MINKSICVLIIFFISTNIHPNEEINKLTKDFIGLNDRKKDYITLNKMLSREINKEGKLSKESIAFYIKSLDKIIMKDDLARFKEEIIYTTYESINSLINNFYTLSRSTYNSTQIENDIYNLFDNPKESIINTIFDNNGIKSTNTYNLIEYIPLVSKGTYKINFEDINRKNILKYFSRLGEIAALNKFNKIIEHRIMLRFSKRRTIETLKKLEVLKILKKLGKKENPYIYHVLDLLQRPEILYALEILENENLENLEESKILEIYKKSAILEDLTGVELLEIKNNIEKKDLLKELKEKESSLKELKESGILKILETPTSLKELQELEKSEILKFLKKIKQKSIYVIEKTINSCEKTKEKLIFICSYDDPKVLSLKINLNDKKPKVYIRSIKIREKI